METSTSLNEFIHFFSLQNNNGTIIFKATVVFYYNGETKEERIEVHIVTVNNLPFIYLMNMDNKEIPDRFDIEQDTMSYVPGLCLRIDKKDREFIALVFPTK